MNTIEQDAVEIAQGLTYPLNVMCNAPLKSLKQGKLSPVPVIGEAREKFLMALWVRGWKLSEIVAFTSFPPRILTDLIFPRMGEFAKEFVLPGTKGKSKMRRKRDESVCGLQKSGGTV